MRTKEVVSWVVYQMTLHNKPAVTAVCEQSEWEQIELSRPGYHTLLRAGFTSECEAEKLARAGAAVSVG